jgi:hypothetical protein
MPQGPTIASLAGEYAVTIPVIQECARRAGVNKQSGAASLYPAEVQKIKAQLGRYRVEERQLAMRRESGVHFELNDHHGPPLARSQRKRFECACCRISVPAPGGSGPSMCPLCVGHFQIADEPPERTMARMRDHAERMPVAFVRAKEAAHEYQHQRDMAYRQRDTWREAAIKLVHDHYDNGKGRCVRCGESFPCHTWKLLEQVNRGCARKAETCLGFSEEELERHLNPIRRRDADYRDDLDDDFFDDEDMA